MQAPAPPVVPPVVRELASANPENTFQPAGELARAPLPEGSPDVGTLAPQLVARRLHVSIWVDGAGAVQRALVEPNELTPEQVVLLERAIARVRFTPARAQDDAPAPAVLRALLCFDDAGRFDTVSDECWKPQPAPER